MAELRGITVKVPAELHEKVKAEQELLEKTMNQYIEMVLEEHFNPKIIEKGGTDMNSNNRTLAFQVSEDFFQRVKDYLAKHPNLKQRDFVVGLIAQELDRFETQENQRTDHMDDIPKNNNETSGEIGSEGCVSPDEGYAGNDSAE